MKPANFKPHSKTGLQSKTGPHSKTRTKDRIARWVSFAALVALLAMATLPLTSGPHHVAVQNTTHWSHSWHG